MANNSSNEAEKKGKHVPEWVWEFLLLVTVAPAIAHAALSPSLLPIV